MYLSGGHPSSVGYHGYLGRRAVDSSPVPGEVDFCLVVFVFYSKGLEISSW